jgi:hypothetical protein
MNAVKMLTAAVTMSVASAGYAEMAAWPTPGVFVGGSVDMTQHTYKGALDEEGETGKIEKWLPGITAQIGYMHTCCGWIFAGGIGLGTPLGKATKTITAAAAEAEVVTAVKIRPSMRFGIFGEVMYLICSEFGVGLTADVNISKHKFTVKSGDNDAVTGKGRRKSIFRLGIGAMYFLTPQCSLTAGVMMPINKPDVSPKKIGDEDFDGKAKLSQISFTVGCRFTF